MSLPGGRLPGLPGAAVLRAALESASTLDELREALELALGQAWDDELEPLRHAGAGAPVRWLNNRVG